MARKVEDIMNSMIAAKDSYPELTGLSKSASAIWRLMFYIVAFAIWSLETLFDKHKSDVDTELSNRKPHRLKWYRDKTLAFQEGYLLPVDSDVYEIIDEEAQVVKYAAAVEAPDSSILLIKIAGGETLRDKLPDEVAEQVRNYLQWIKDAGVRINLINESPDYFQCEFDIYYNAMLLPDRVETSVREAINAYIENLPFNGEYSNMALVDVLQNVEGVVIPELITSYSKPASGGLNYTLINAKRIPEAGYFRAYMSTDIILNMKVYELAEN